MIVKQANKYLVKSKLGRKLGEFTSVEAAKRRLKIIEQFKHDKKTASVEDDKGRD